MLAFCRNCNTIFRSRASGTDAQPAFPGSEAVCSQCGCEAMLLDDVSRFGETVCVLLAGPTTSSEMFRFYYEVVSEAQRTSLSPEEAVEKLKEEAPALADAVMSVKRPRRWFVIGVLLVWLEMLQNLQGPATKPTLTTSFHRALLKVAKYLSV